MPRNRLISKAFLTTDASNSYRIQIPGVPSPPSLASPVSQVTSTAAIASNFPPPDMPGLWLLIYLALPGAGRGLQWSRAPRLSQAAPEPDSQPESPTPEAVKQGDVLFPFKG